MELLFILLCTIFLLLSSFLLFIWRNDTDKYGGMTEGSVFAFMGVVFFLTMLIFIVSLSYHAAYTEPYEYDKYDNIVEEQKLLLMKYENLSGDIGNIGNGLESMELKETISDTIKSKEEYMTRIKARLNHPFLLFKGVTRANCELLGIKI